MTELFAMEFAINNNAINNEGKDVDHAEIY